MPALRIFAPALIDFNERLGSAAHDPEAYQQVWRALEAAGLPDELAGGASPPRLEVRRTLLRGRFNRYAHIDVDTLERPVEALVITLAADHVGEVCPSVLNAAPGSVEIEVRLFDHGIFIVEAEVALVLPPGLSVADHARHLDAVQDAAVGWGERLAREVHDRYLVPVVRRLRSLDSDGMVVQPALRAHGTDPATVGGEVLWVTRSLLLETGTPALREMAEHWTLHSREHTLDLAPDTQHVMRWLNYLFVRPPVLEAFGETFRDQWAALRIAQFYYAALEDIDVQLTRVLADSIADQADASARELQAELEECSRRATFIGLQLAETKKHLSRPVRAEFDGLFGFWDFDAVVEEPVRLKVAACERRLRELAEQRSARASIFTDTILLAIGVTSIIGTTLALTEYGRSMSVDPDMAGFDPEGSGITGWFAAQSTDVLLVGSAAMAVLLTIVYVYLRRSHDR